MCTQEFMWNSIMSVQSGAVCFVGSCRAFVLFPQIALVMSLKSHTDYFWILWSTKDYLRIVYGLTLRVWDWLEPTGMSVWLCEIVTIWHYLSSAQVTACTLWSLGKCICILLRNYTVLFVTVAARLMCCRYAVGLWSYLKSCFFLNKEMSSN